MCDLLDTLISHGTVFRRCISDIVESVCPVLIGDTDVDGDVSGIKAGPRCVDL